MLRSILLVCALFPEPGDPPPPAPVLDLRAPGEADRWFVVNDGVMGGLSRSAIRFPEGEPAVFAGRVSLENNGGFASVRRLPGDLGLGGLTGVVLHVRGDGATYQFRVRTDEGIDGVAYVASFPTRAGEWERIAIRFDALEPSFRGRRVRAPALDPATIRQIGFLIAGGQEGPFRLEIDRLGPLPEGTEIPPGS